MPHLTPNTFIHLCIKGGVGWRWSITNDQINYNHGRKYSSIYPSSYLTATRQPPSPPPPPPSPSITFRPWYATSSSSLPLTASLFKLSSEIRDTIIRFSKF